MSENEGNTSAVVHNIRAAKRAVNTVKTTLGPMGMDKMLGDGGGNRVHQRLVLDGEIVGESFQKLLPY